MTTALPNLSLLDQFKSESELAQKMPLERLELSPPLVLAAALLYMMAADGEIKESESSQLQSVLGGNDELVSCAVSYVQSVSLDVFLSEAAQSLSTPDKLCILTNVCDSLLADGSADDTELALFHRMYQAFGFSETSFAPYFKTIELKNNKSILGPFDADLMHATPISNHLALAASLVYMMASDGSIGEEEIGRLQAVIGEFEGLQSAALKYVLKVKNNQFLKEVAPTFGTEMKLLILTNVCDTLLADGRIDAAEKKLFHNMMTAFGYTEETFSTYFNTLHIKNVKPFELKDFTYSDAAKAFRSEQYKENQATLAASGEASNRAMGIIVQRTMKDNIASVSGHVGGDENIHQIEDNANNQQSQTPPLETPHRAENIQKLNLSAPVERSASSLQADILALGPETPRVRRKPRARANTMEDASPTNGTLTVMADLDDRMDPEVLKARLQALRQKNKELEGKLNALNPTKAEGSSFLKNAQGSAATADNKKAANIPAAATQAGLFQRIRHSLGAVTGLFKRKNREPGMASNLAV